MLNETMTGVKSVLVESVHPYGVEVDPQTVAAFCIREAEPVYPGQPITPRYERHLRQLEERRRLEWMRDRYLKTQNNTRKVRERSFSLRALFGYRQKSAQNNKHTIVLSPEPES
mmetsp:Transcript_16640/g.26980  ORF Transcript_16640/g.26980 Transcript_16640/m.26980 type:complete len:114 (-) Transcript_16640:1755-2096(-)